MRRRARRRKQRVSHMKEIGKWWTALSDSCISWIYIDYMLLMYYEFVAVYIHFDWFLAIFSIQFWLADRKWKFLSLTHLRFIDFLVFSLSICFELKKRDSLHSRQKTTVTNSENIERIKGKKCISSDLLAYCDCSSSIVVDITVLWSFDFQCSSLSCSAAVVNQNCVQFDNFLHQISIEIGWFDVDIVLNTI